MRGVACTLVQARNFRDKFIDIGCWLGSFFYWTLAFDGWLFKIRLLLLLCLFLWERFRWFLGLTLTEWIGLGFRAFFYLWGGHLTDTQTFLWLFCLHYARYGVIHLPGPFTQELLLVSLDFSLLYLILWLNLNIEHFSQPANLVKFLSLFPDQLACFILLVTYFAWALRFFQPLSRLCMENLIESLN